MSNYIGNKYNRLFIVKKANKKNNYVAICDCGNVGEYYIYNILSGHTKSCGCLAKEELIKRSKTHGLSRNEPLYRIWLDMKRRCNNKNRKAYKNYGGRGIKVCDEWANDFNVFYTWAIENGWKQGLEIDRRNNDGNYTPDNCRIVTILINANNKSTNVFISFKGERLTISEWARRYKISPLALYSRIKNNWDMEDALTLPIKKKGGSPSLNRYVRSIKYSFGYIY